MPSRPFFIWSGSTETSRAPSACRKLTQINRVRELAELTVPPGNRLERLTGDRSGQHSIRINDQYRVCFRWKEGVADHVEITDYH